MTGSFRREEILPIIEAMKSLIDQLMALTEQLTGLVVALIKLMR